MNPERLAAYRKSFGPMSTEELRAIVEGRKPHKLGEESLEAIRLLLAERKGGYQEGASLKSRAAEGRTSSMISPLDVETMSKHSTGQPTPLPTLTRQTAGAKPSSQARRPSRLILSLGIAALLLLVVALVIYRPGVVGGLLETKNEKLAKTLDDCIQGIQIVRNDLATNKIRRLKMDMEIGLRRNLSSGKVEVTPFFDMVLSGHTIQLDLAILPRLNIAFRSMYETVGASFTRTLDDKAGTTKWPEGGELMEQGLRDIFAIAHAQLPSKWEFLETRRREILRVYRRDSEALHTDHLEKHMEKDLEARALSPVDAVLRSLTDLRDELRRGDTHEK